MAELFKKKFVILTMQRTGSNMLVSALSTHPDIHCDYEVFHPDGIYVNGTHPGTMAERNDDPVGHIGRLMSWTKKARALKSVYGFKLFLYHDQVVMDTVLEDPSWLKIILKRENVLDQFISEQIAHQSGVWTSEQGKAPPMKIRLDREDFLRYREQIEEQFSVLEKRLVQSGQTYVSLDYQDVAAQRFEKIFSFLGVKTSLTTNSRLEKQNPKRTADKVSNPWQVRWWLWRLGLSHMWVN